MVSVAKLDDLSVVAGTRKADKNTPITDVVIKDGKIYFTTQEDGQTFVYQTGAINDPQLVDRLLKAKSSNPGGKIAFNQEMPQKNSPLLDFILMWVLPGLIFYLIWRQTSKAIQSRMGGGGGNFMSFGKSGARIYADSDVKTTFADVAGQDEAKEALTEIVDFLHNPRKYFEIGASLPKGALLAGPPGTGQTLIARAVAGEAKVPFFAISGSEFVQMFVGMGAAKVRDLFRQASEKAPCIIFIDEIDAIGKRRDTGMGSNDEREQTLNQLLTEMDGFDGRKGVVILAATNRPESLDKALLRPGRFDRRIQMELPDLEGRKAIFGVHLKKVKCDRIDMDVVARATAGSSGAELANIVNEAALRAVPHGAPEGYYGRFGRKRGNRDCRCSEKRQGNLRRGEEDRFLPRNRSCAGGSAAEPFGPGSQDYDCPPHFGSLGLHHAGGQGRAGADEPRGPFQPHRDTDRRPGR